MSTRHLVLTLTASAALALAPLPANAASHTTYDERGDVVSGNSEAGDPHHLEPGRAEGDALTMRVMHGNKMIRIKLRVAGLTRSRGTQTAHVFALRTNEGRRAELSLYVHGNRWQGERLWTVDDRDRPCRGLRTRINYRADAVAVVIPRGCLSNPRWVQVGGGIGSYAGSTLYADDVSLVGRIGHDLALGPRIQRG